MIKLPKAGIVKAKNPKDYTLIVSSIEKFSLEANSIENYKTIKEMKEYAESKMFF